MLVGVSATIFTLQNKCENDIWPGIQPGAGKDNLRNGGFRLGPNEVVTVNAPYGWSGRFWGRVGCSFDQTGKGSCLTGDCGGVLECSGAGGAPAASLAEFTVNSPNDFYDISLVDGFNVPISISPSGGTGMCKSLSCASDLNQNCPSSLQVLYKKRVMECKSACMVFNTPEYCCTGAYAQPSMCKPTNYSNLFKEACPDAYRYAFDDSTSIVTCTGANYLITFC
ncbi:hypothetical protein C5167_039666 [Papaver somniferum]|uniref:Thaumatin-like protein n=1 Tax=Papaver somniferum TaxID=3469 RepID=A0A4Y7ICR7_PAPSO|nr:thaumatin-like protein [Papaver somniferum]RZC46713.1 hypothetical protein C5167_039666 [Papaver somniferum]